MTVRPYTSEDFSLISSWWEARSFPLIPAKFLPKTGFVVENHAVGFLYATDSSIAWMEWVTTNPASDKIDRDKSLNILIENLLTEAKRQGFAVVFTSANDEGLISRYERHGVAVQDRNVTQMMRIL